MEPEQPEPKHSVLGLPVVFTAFMNIILSLLREG